jgi:hypothetical protein
MGDSDTAANGAVMRLSTLRRYAEDAGFRTVEVLPIATETCASTDCIAETASACRSGLVSTRCGQDGTEPLRRRRWLFCC